MQGVRRMKITFKDGTEKTIKGAFKEESRIVYEIDWNGETVGVYNFDEIREIQFFEEEQGIMLVG
ncbi:hypothetical protein [Archaeoglobus sp. JdFR-39]|jgi:mRNA-degrading endonuclease RelE of RelBE toxin-antitoxin system|uniref:hypothetical protein n=1 Tax=Archaeoglobus sp. JdFR-39 TaxID=1934996 RepID=UPI0025C68361|nr:hypothetical protein [Archaeoglobus sp. JdFR-39]